MNNTDIIIQRLLYATKEYPLPLIDQIIALYGQNSYLILIACLISLRAQDKTTIHICKVLFDRVKTPQELLLLPENELEKILFKSGFYRQKAKVLRTVSQELIDKHAGSVPPHKELLLELSGVGPKTANLVLGMAFAVPEICVDTHVHRISNRLGLITTKTVDETEIALKKLLKPSQWIIWNKLLVMWGQQRCTPRSPHCSDCPLITLCKRRFVDRSR